MNFSRPAIALALATLICSCSPLRSTAQFSCDAPQNIPPAKILLFGEMHGSAETPALVGEVACARALAGPTVIALEIWGDEQAAIDRYLGSDGGSDARAQMLAGRFWKIRDGRSSTAMAGLIERARVLKQQGAPLEVIAIDVFGTPVRDPVMAQTIRTYSANHPDTAVVALMGNIHSSSEKMADIVTAGSLLQDLAPTSVLVMYASGTIWACMSGCGVHEIDSEWGKRHAPGFHDDAPIEGYSIAYRLPSLTASLPATAAP